MPARTAKKRRSWHALASRGGSRSRPIWRDAGRTFSWSPEWLIAVGCTLYGLPPLGALTAATVNPAWVLGLSDRLGTLDPGKRADFVVLDADEFRMVPYRPGHNPVRATFMSGRLVAGSI